ncbi:MAG: hypothetical protein IJ304_05525 [Clostridia bacterium]|nr:hypothetical protein [Clostridia bacterium]
MEYLSKVSIRDKVRRDHVIKISLVGSVCLLGLVLGIYSLAINNFLFALWYALAFVLGLSYVIIRINACFPTFIATNGEKVVLSRWKNGIMPYTLPEKPNFISDFIPEKVQTSEIAMEDIDAVVIGSRRFLNKNLSEEEYPEILKRLDLNKHFDNVLKRMDFIFVRTKNDENCFMSITDFDLSGVNDFLDVIEKNCPGVSIQINIPKLVKMRNIRE